MHQSLLMHVQKQRLLHSRCHNLFYSVLVHCKIRIIQDNLNTHSPGSFYEAFGAKEAFDLSQRFEMHYTPKSASWLNMVEIELSILSKQCLDRRIGEMETLKREVYAWVSQRNQKHATVSWQFTNEKAREKFSKFYPNLS